MRLPLAPYGIKEMALSGLLCAAASAACLALHVPWLIPVPVLVFLAVLLFFRDPPRRIPEGPGVLVAPADGKVVAIEEVEGEEYIDGPAIRLDIFLAVYNVHVNRAPLEGVVRYLGERPGGFENALRAEAGEVNHARSLGIFAEPGGFPVLVRQIVGAVARRIVCTAKVGDRLERGERFGMLKFGSRTQLVVPREVPLEFAVKVGDRVRAGVTVIGVVRGE